MAKHRLLVSAISCALIAAALAFVTQFRDNLHCTQWTSFRIASFDFVPHVEEALEGTPPVVYRLPYAVPLRAYLSSTIVAFLFFPPIGALLVIRNRLALRRWAQATLCLSALVLANGAIPPSLAGERYRALNLWTIFLAAAPLAVLWAALWLQRRSSVRAASGKAQPCSTESS